MSTEEFELNCTVRTDLGKGASRRLRHLNNDIPAVLYGGGEDPVSLTIAHKDIAKATENEAFFSHIITLNVGKKKQKAVIKALQRHPAKAILMHADFQRVSDKVEITVNVPLHFLNEDKCAGVKTGGGSIIKTLNEIEIHCFPKDLPEFIEVDMLLLEIGDAVHIADITLPEGVASIALAAGNDLSVATVQAPRAEVEEAADAPETPDAPESEAGSDESEEKED
ncbi:MAG: 50S ribosomal protein L25/general stress protein Ctc [SAR86 cluster bacterium]|uniref:Large ribosomal subunit protein bL25 n=1 Tax=SAR86 cluster bacterium TaxID=2030880 RepID=A0A2A4XEJ4_9GAMM|nr:MAG: 50S ribosomal protein L25/general stress protein Ctc [SAR86 cluster bacterium]